MVNLEHKLTVDDLIVEYMIYKVKNGYEPSFMTSEFINFLYFFESKMPVEDALYENEKLFQRFFERKSESDWSRTVSWKTLEKEIIPHMDMIYIEASNDYLIKANYKLSEYDRSIINTYFMDNGMGQYDNFKGQTFKIRSIIKDYLEDAEKRTIDTNIMVDEEAEIIGKYIAANIVSNIWERHINNLIYSFQWPKQCTDINTYLFETDLAKIIGIKSIKNTLIELYNIFSKRISVLYNQDKNLKISIYKNKYLARANYDLLIQGYEKIMNNTFNIEKKPLDIDLSKLISEDICDLDTIYECDDEEIIKNKNPKIKKLIKNLDNKKE